MRGRGWEGCVVPFHSQDKSRTFSGLLGVFYFLESPEIFDSRYTLPVYNDRIDEDQNTRRLNYSQS